MPTKKPARKPARRARRSAPSFHLPALEQRQLDLIGLGLVGLGLFFGFLVYLGWEGGRAGSEAVEGLRWLLGAGHYLVPVGLLCAGAILMLRPVLPAVRPFRSGAICLFLAVTLGLSAGTVGPGRRAAELVGRRVGQDPRRDGGGDARLGRRDAGREHRRAHPGDLPVRGRRAAADRRVGRERDQVRVGLGHVDVARGPDRGVDAAPAPDRGAGDAGALHARAREGAAGRDGRGAAGVRQHLGRAGARSRAPEPDAEPTLAEDPPEDEDGVTRGPVEPVEPEQLTPQGRYRPEVTESPDFVWQLPDPAMLTRSSEDASKPDTAGQEKVAAQLLEALGHFNIEARVIGMVAGPHITRYELRLAPGIKVGKVAQLKDDLAYALAAADIRILAPIPGKQAVGIEVPNARRRIVHLGDVYQAPPPDWSPLTVWLGKDVAGRAIGADLAKMPHLLVAGTTGAGKSGAVNAMLSSILLRATPHEVRMVLVDPKQVELTHYDSIPHLLTPVITSPRQAATALQNLVREMEQRYTYMALARTRTLVDLNVVRAGRDEPPLPYILCVIDELADLMMVAPADVEDSIIRIAQKARAVGIHLVLATQSPRVDVITGMIKANVPSRIAFAVSSQTDSRVILDQNGAESLLGMGDMLFSPVGSSRLQRIQGAFIDEAQIEALTGAWRDQGEPELREDLLEVVEEEPAESSAPDEFDPDEDPLLADAIQLVAEMQTASTSMLQRRLRLGYTRAGRLIDMLERRGVISGYEGSKPRQVLVTEADVPRVLAALTGEPARVPDDDAAPG